MNATSFAVKNYAASEKLAGRILLIALLALILFPISAFAQACSSPTSTWSGGAMGSWNTATNWTPSGIPGSASNTCINTASSAVTVSGGATDNLQLALSTDSLAIANGTTLTITAGGNIVNSGSLTLNSSGSGTDISLLGATTLSGSGTLTMSNNANNYFTGGSGASLTNQSTIQGAGTIGNGSAMALVNSGTIDANVSSALTINMTGGYSNTGTLEATAGGELILDNTLTNTGGTILASGSSAVVLNGSSITGGTLTSSTGGIIYGQSSATLNTLTISTGTTFDVQNGQQILFGAGTITNNGTINLQSGGSSTDISIGGATTLAGTGSITMSNNVNNYFTGTGTLTNQETIQGSGSIGNGSAMALVNSGTIDANVSSALTINATGGVTNTATLEATAGGELILDGTYTNTGGTILATGTSGGMSPTASAVVLNGSTINGGTLTSNSGGIIYGQSSANISGVTISSGTTFDVQNAQQVLLTGTITNNGTMNLLSSGSTTDFEINGSVTLTGGGTVILSNNNNNLFTTAAAGNTLTNVNNVISGSGNIGDGAGMNFINEAGGTVDATSASGTQTLTIQPYNGSVGATTNLGLMEASSGGTLQLLDTITNTGGTIEALAGGVLDLNGTDLLGGTLTSLGTGVINAYGNATLDGTSGHAITLTAGSVIDVPNSYQIIADGTIMNLGTINLQSSGSGTDISLGSGNLTLTGAGNVTMSNNANNYFTGSSGATLTNQQTIQGSGSIGNGSAMALVNSATIDANVSNALSINLTGGTTNTGTLEATAGGELILDGTYINTGGTILASGSSAVVLNGSSITGGTLTSSTGGIIYGQSSATLNTLTISTGTTFDVQNGQQILFGAGTITNNGTINLQSGGSGTDISIGGATTLAGTGSITMSNNVNNYFTGTGTLTNQETIQGSGSIGNGSAMALVNSGTIDANVSSALTINATGGVTNTATLEATAGGELILDGTYTNTGGTILATGTNSVVVLNAASVTNGTLASTSGGIIYGQNSATLNTLTISTGTTFDVQNGQQILFGAGTITNNGTINLQSSGSGTDISISGATTLAGTGSITMSNNANNYFTGSGTLTNQETIQGSGNIGDGSAMGLTNSGTIDADVSSPLTIDSTGAVTNTKTFEATAGGELIVDGTITNTGGTIEATGTGSEVVLNGSKITGGTLTSNTGGTIYGQGSAEMSGLTISSGTTFDLQNSQQVLLAGTITNNGTINLQSSGSGTDLDVQGNVTLAGTGKVIFSANANNYITGSGGTLTNDSTIEGEGNIGNGAIALVNEDLIEASITAGGTLIIDPSTGLTNNLGTKNGILDVLAKNTMIIEGGGLTNYSSATNTLTGGEYEVTGTLEFNAGANGIETNDAIIILTGTTASILNTGASNASALANFSDNGTKGTFTVNSGKFTDTNNFTNSGTLTAGSGSTLDFSTGLTNFNSGTNTLTGGTYDVTGTLEFAGANIVINDATITLTGAAPKILNSTNSANALAGFDDNKGTFTVNSGTFTDANSFTNTGTLAAGALGVFNASGGLTNFNNTNGTLTGGSYSATTTGQIQFNNEGFTNDIVTNDAKITLAGVDTTKNPFIDQSGGNALQNFATNGASGSLYLTTDRVFTNTGSLTNAGIVDVEISTGTGKTELIIGGPGVYTQTGGTTTVDGVLSASGGINIQGGFLYGNALTKTGAEGTLIGAVDLTGGTLNPGNAVKLLGTIDITGTYSESGTGVLNIDLDGTVAGTKYDVLNVSGAAALGGTIDFVLNAAFKPVVGDTWDVLNYASATGSFTTVELPTAPVGDQYVFACGATDCTLSLETAPVAPAAKGTVSGAPATRVSRNAGAVTSTTTHEPSAILAKVTCFAGRLLGSESCGREAAATVASSGEAHAASSDEEVHNNIMVATHSVSAGRGAASHETSASAMARLYVCAYFPASVGHTMGCN